MRVSKASLCIILAILTAFSAFGILPAGALSDPQADINASVIITKTDIKADSVSNTSGYGSLFIKRSYLDGKSVPSQAALIDGNGAFLFPYKDTSHRYRVSDDIVSLVSGPYINYVNDPVGFYTLDGNVAFTDNYYGATNMKGGYAFVTKECNWNDQTVKSYLVDNTGQVVNEFQDGFNQLVYMGGNDSSSMISAKDNTSATIFDELLLCWSYASLEDYCNGIIESIFYMDTTGQKVLVLPMSEYSSASNICEGLAGVQSAKTKKWGYISKAGELIIPCVYDSVGYFHENMAYVSKDNKWGYINTKNETVIPFEYDSAYGAGEGLATVGKGGKFGLVDYNNNVVVPLEYDDISTFEGGVAYAIKDGYVYIITKNKTQEVLLGSADGDGEITILDATIIQRVLANFSEKNFNAEAADVDNDSEVTIIDATYIQRFLAGLSCPEGIGKAI